MMIRDNNSKVTATHLKRNAYLYVRQSTMRQVITNTESSERQYALRDRALALGFSEESIVVIDDDQGQSGATITQRHGFQHLVSEVGMGHAGLVMGLEVSRLARNNVDWHRLLEICALSGTLILDEDGLYNPGNFNDRLLLGLKGTMSEAELYMIRTRLQGGLLNKARRGEFAVRLPVGFLYDREKRVVLDPDKQVQSIIKYLFKAFRQTGSARATAGLFRRESLLFPKRIFSGPQKGELVWTPLCHARVVQIINNPRYAGAYFYGRSQGHHMNGRYSRKKKGMEDWYCLLKDSHPGYITWETFEENRNRLRKNLCRGGTGQRRTPPREGPALLQGLAICGVCGCRMYVSYHTYKGSLVPTYTCQSPGVKEGGKTCQSLRGFNIDAAIGDVLLDVINPHAMSSAIRVQETLQKKIQDADNLYRMRLDKAQYEADLARQRYMEANPSNRMVADVLEDEWNLKLKEVKCAQKEFDEKKRENAKILTKENKQKIRSIANDFPSLWRDRRIPQRERKRMVRLLIEDVTMLRSDKQFHLHIRLKGGKVKTKIVQAPLPIGEFQKTSTDIVNEIDKLLDDYLEEKIAEILNQKKKLSGTGKKFSRGIVQTIRRHYNLPSRYQRLRDKGLKTQDEMAKLLQVKKITIQNWRKQGILQAQRTSYRHDYLFEPIPQSVIQQTNDKPQCRKAQKLRELLHRTNEVQYEV